MNLIAKSKKGLHLSNRGSRIDDYLRFRCKKYGSGYQKARLSSLSRLGSAPVANQRNRTAR